MMMMMMITCPADNLSAGIISIAVFFLS